MGCTQAQFDSIYNICRPIFEKYTHTGQERKRSQHNNYFYSNKFQLLVTLFWLRMYVGEVFISRIFNISQRLVNKFINRCINVLYESVANSFIGFNRKKLILWKNEFSTAITHHVPNACVVIDGTEIKINKSSNKEIEKEEYSSKKRIHSVNVLVAVLLNGRCIYVSDACPVSHDQQQWNMLNLRRHFEGIPVGIIGDAGFHFNPVNVLKSGRPFILGYRIKTPKTEEDKIHNKVVSQLRIVVENFIGQMKKFRCISEVFRHYRSKTREQQRESIIKISKIVKIVAYLAQTFMKNPHGPSWKPKRIMNIPKGYKALPDNHHVFAMMNKEKNNNMSMIITRRKTMKNTVHGMKTKRSNNSSNNNNNNKTTNINVNNSSLQQSFFLDQELNGMMKSINDELELKKGLLVSSWKRLAGFFWLNDEVINSYLSLLNKRVNNCHIVVVVSSLVYSLFLDNKTNSVKNWIKKNVKHIHQLNEIYIPINVNGNHWCLVVVNVHKKQIELFDSMLSTRSDASSSSSIISNVCTFLMLFTETTSSTKIIHWNSVIRNDVAQQMNSIDCGVFILEYARRIMTGFQRMFPNHKIHLRQLRKRLMVELATENLIRRRGEENLEKKIKAILQNLIKSK